MHLLLAQKGSLNESDEAIDLGQSPGDLIFLSAADTELLAVAEAGKTAAEGFDLRVANLMQLSHPMSIDVYAENTVAKSRAVIVRVLGGESYWQYGLEKLLEAAQRHGVKLIALPGDDKPDPSLFRYSSEEPEIVERCWSYLREGGSDNMQNLLAYVRWHLDGGEEPPAAVPLMKAGVWSPKHGVCDLEKAASNWQADAPIAAIVFYRALVLSGGFQPITAVINSLSLRGINALPIFVSSLKDPVSIETVGSIFEHAPPGVILNATGFAVSSPAIGFSGTVLDQTGVPVIQMVLAGSSKQAWESSQQGLSARDLAMNIALPEVDGRIFSRAVAFKNSERHDEKVQANLTIHEAHDDAVEWVSAFAESWLRLQTTPIEKKRVAVILANYPNRDGRLGNGVGLDTPAGTVNVLNAMRDTGYSIFEYPENGNSLIEHLMEGPTNSALDGRIVRETLDHDSYRDFFASLPEEVRKEITKQWGEPENDPFFLPDDDAFALPIARFGEVVVGIQPARGYNIDPTETYHSPDLVPPHGYLAFYAWLRKSFDAHAIVHMGKHGNLEWLPGKALSLSDTCYPQAVLGPIPNFYPFIVNDPGEGTQAKRRISSVIIDHLTPPLTRAESYGPLADLEALVDEYYEASGNDPRRLKLLKRQILELVEDIGLDADAGIVKDDGDNDKLEKLDGYLCELKEMQIRDGLHIFGQSPTDTLRTDLIAALLRVPRGEGEAEHASLQRSIADDCGCGLSFDPLDCEMSAAWKGPKPELLQATSNDPWRTNGDTVERIELLVSQLIAQEVACPESWLKTQAVLAYQCDVLRPAVDACGELELRGLMQGLDGKFIDPGPSGAPTRGRLDVLPTGRNFFSVDSRSVPTPAAWELGRRSAELLITRYRQDHGEWPTSFGLSAWGTSNMRTGGDDIAQAMALIGARPQWDHASRRVMGYEIIPIAELGRPRVDVTLRISGFFRDAFPSQIALFDKAIRAIGLLEETNKDNPIAMRMAEERAKLISAGVDEKNASQRSGYRIYGSKPGAYGAGLQALIDEKGWERTEDLANAYMTWGSYAYGSAEEGVEDRTGFKRRLSGVEAVIHNQDNREHDLLDSDDYYQFEGGMIAAVKQASGKRPAMYHNDHSRPEKPVIRALDEEIARVVRGRAANPKWIAGVMRHGYKGAFEMAATLDYTFAFSATTGAVGNHHFELLHNAWLVDDEVLDFLKANNPEALKEMAERFIEAIDRGLWTPRSNSARFDLQNLAGGD